MSVLEGLAGVSLSLLGLCLAVLHAEDSAPALLDRHSEPCTTATYQKRLRALKCNAIYGQQLMDVYLDCGYNKMARMEYINCGQHKGEFCFDMVRRAQQYLLDVDALCFDTYGKPSFSNSCQEALWSFRDNVGCCINNLYNASDEPLSNDRTASYLLWTACGVTTLDGLCTSTLHYEEVYDTPVCVYDEVVYRKSLLDCSPDYGQAFADLFRVCGYSPQLQRAVSLCGVNGENRYCFEHVSDGDSLAAIAQDLCVETENEECSTSCKVVLDDFRKLLGCCVNNLYNDKDNSYFGITSPALWKTCSLKRPPFCKSTISMTGGTSQITFSLSVIFTLLITLCCVR